MANSYLSKTFGTPTDTKKYTMSVWVKRCAISVQQSIARSTNGNDDSHVFTFNSDDSLRWDEYGSSSTIGTLKTNRKFRDTSAWYHVVLWYDSANSTAGDRMRMWINGVEETSFATDTNPSLNAASAFNKASQPINIGRTSYSGGGNYFDGYLSHMAFVDGANVAHTTFGETDSTSGIWSFKSPTGITWGTNGFHLKFENSSNLGVDSSSNASNWTVNGNLKQALDTPSNVHATFNPLNYSANTTVFSNGNTTVTTTGDNADNSYACTTLGASSGKWYWEGKQTASVTYSFIGVDTMPNMAESIRGDTNPGNSGVGYRGDGQKRVQGSNSSFGNTYGQNDIISVALDLDNNYVYFGKNGTWQNSGDPTSGSSGTGGIAITGISGYDTEYLGCIVGDNSSGEGSATWNMNFGNGLFGTTAISDAGSNGNGSLFEYDVPSGYYALNTKNINTYG